MESDSPDNPAETVAEGADRAPTDQMILNRDMTTTSPMNVDEAAEASEPTLSSQPPADQDTNMPDAPVNIDGPADQVASPMQQESGDLTTQNRRQRPQLRIDTASASNLGDAESAPMSIDQDDLDSSHADTMGSRIDSPNTEFSGSPELSSAVRYIPGNDTDDGPKDKGKGKLQHHDLNFQVAAPPPSPRPARLAVPAMAHPSPRPGAAAIPFRMASPPPRSASPRSRQLATPSRHLATPALAAAEHAIANVLLELHKPGPPKVGCEPIPLSLDSPSPPSLPDDDGPPTPPTLEGSVPQIVVHQPPDEPEKGQDSPPARLLNPFLLTVPGSFPLQSQKRKLRDFTLGYSRPAKRQNRSGPSFLHEPASFGPKKPEEEVSFLFATLRHGMHVLNLGCREGDVTLQLRDDLGTNGTIVGIDYSMKNIVIARAKRELQQVPNVSFRQVDDMTNLPYPDNSFDYVYASDLMNRLPYVEDGSNVIDHLNEMLRVVKPGGHIATRDLNSQRFFPDLDLDNLLTKQMLKAAGFRGDLVGGCMPYLYQQLGANLDDDEATISATTSC